MLDNQGFRSRRGVLGMAAGGAFASVLPGCATPERGPAVPFPKTTRATVTGLPNERFFPAEGTEALTAEFYAAIHKLQRSSGLAPNQLPSKISLMAVSGGGEDGAFGAGLLCGWTEAGTRPVFELVTGVSTRALTAPFAFLGSSYDPQLRAVYTDLKPSDVLEQRSLLNGAVFGDGMADNSPLFKTISRYLTPAMQADIATAYNNGRLLLIGTTNLDAQLPVIWNVGAIAASNHPQALDTIRRILLASAAVPGAFPPTMFDVSADGVAYQEMHVDGGAFAQAFLYPASATQGRRERIKKGQPVMDIEAYVIRNARLDPNWAAVERRTLGIVGRAVSTMIASSGFNDVLRMYNTTKADDIAFKLAYIGMDFNMKLPQPFDPGYMRSLFDYGYQKSRHGYDWKSRPPGTSAA